MIWLGQGDMAKKKKYHDILFYISVDIYNYHNICQICISLKFKGRFLLLIESCKKQSVNCVFKLLFKFMFICKNSNICFFCFFM